MSAGWGACTGGGKNGGAGQSAGTGAGRLGPLRKQRQKTLLEPVPALCLVWKFGDRKRVSIAKNHSKPSQEFAEQFRPSIHKMRGFSWSSPQKVHPNFAQNLGRQILGNTFSGLKNALFWGSCARPSGSQFYYIPLVCTQEEHCFFSDQNLHQCEHAAPTHEKQRKRKGRDTVRSQILTCLNFIFQSWLGENLPILIPICN